MAGYIRQDTTNNIADGNVINASDFDNEYNAIEAAFHATTGHTHDGTAAEGAPITKIGPTQDVVASISALTPKTDNTIDLGSSVLEFKDLWIDGTANIDSLVADTADINGGSIDNSIIGAGTPADATFTSISVTGATANRVPYATTGGLITDSANLTFDGTTLSTSAAVLTTADINGGTVDGVTIGGAVRGAGSFTTLNANGNTTLGDAVGDVVTVNGTTTFANAAPTLTPLTASQAVFTNGSKTLVSNAITGTGNVVMSASPTLTGTVAGASMQLSSLTSGRVTYAGASGLLQDSANLTFSGTDLTVSGLVNATTLDATNLEVTNLKAKDGTSAGSIANSTGVVTLASSVLTTADINGGTMDNVTIGGSTPAAGNFTNLDATGTLAVDGNVTLGDSSADAVTINGTVAPGVVISGSSSGNALRITQTGSGNALLVEDSANPDATPFLVTADGKLGIGVPTSSYFPANIGFYISANDGNSRGVIQRMSADTGGAQFYFRKGRGTIELPAAVASGDRLATLSFSGWGDASNVYDAATIISEVDGTPGTNDMPGRLVFSTTADGASTPTERYRINSAGIHFFGNTTTNTNSTLMVVNGEISETTSGTQYKLASQYDIGTEPNDIPLNQYLGTMAFQDADAVSVGYIRSNSTTGSGYALGAGSTVTQITSRTTGVTINAACGAITLVSAAGTTTPASFTVTNSSVAATDVIILNQKSGTDKQVLLVTAVAAGSFEITAYTTGGTTTEQPVINFAVIKAVTA